MSWLLLALLVACQQGQPPGPPPRDREAPTFSLRLEPPMVQLTIDETASLRVELHRSEGFDAAVGLRPAPGAALPTGLQLGSLDLAEGQSEGEIVMMADDRLAPGSYDLVLEASGGDQAKHLVLLLELRPPLARFDRVVVEGAGESRQLRQGHGPAVLLLHGQHFDRVEELDLEGFAVTVLDGRSDQELRLALEVGHGLEAGPRALSMTTPGYGTATLPDALLLSYLTAAPEGDDLTGLGTPDLPYRSLGRALAEAEEGDTVWLQDGFYELETGEDWPMATWTPGFPPIPPPQPNLPDGVRLLGQSRDGVVLTGGLTAADESRVGLAFAGSGRVERLTLMDFATAVLAGEGEQWLVDVGIIHNLEGVVTTEGSSLTIEDSLLQGNAHEGMRMHDGAVTARDVAFEQNRFAFTALGASQVEMHGVSVLSSLHDALGFYDQSSAFIHGALLQDNGWAGIYFAGHDLTLRDSVLSGNQDSGMLLSGEPQKVDLGDLLEPGGNLLEDNSPFQFEDLRSDREDLFGVEVSLSATRLQGTVPAPDVVVGPLSQGNLYRIWGVNQRIQFH